MKFQPLYDRLVLRRIEAEKVTAGGIFIPDAAQEKPLEALVLAVGPGVRGDNGVLHPTHVKVGDMVLISKRVGTEMTIEGELVLVLREPEVIGIIGQ